MKLYDILYFFYSESGQVDLSFSTLLKKPRSPMMGNYLASEESVKKVLGSCCSTLQFCLDHKLDAKFFEVNKQRKFNPNSSSPPPSPPSPSCRPP